MSEKSGNVILKVDHLSAAYGGIRAIDDISFTVKAGEIVAMLGANGAGKSTLLKCLSGEHKRSAGEISLTVSRFPATAIRSWNAGSPSFRRDVRFFIS